MMVLASDGAVQSPSTFTLCGAVEGSCCCSSLGDVCMATGQLLLPPNNQVVLVDA